MHVERAIESALRPCVLLAAAPGESRAIRRGAWAATGADPAPLPPPVADLVPVELRPGLWLVQTGVGKVSAAIAAEWAARTLRPASMLSIGIAGALPAEDSSSAVPLLSIVLATGSIYADEGILAPTGFTDIATAGFAPSGLQGMGVVGSPVLLKAVRSVLTGSLGTHDSPRLGPVATVSTCSGTNALAQAIATRTGALAEAMEGAAIGHALSRLHPGVHFAELRVISNTTGDRASQVWDLPGAFGVLEGVARRLAEAWSAA